MEREYYNGVTTRYPARTLDRNNYADMFEHVVNREYLDDVAGDESWNETLDDILGVARKKSGKDTGFSKFTKKVILRLNSESTSLCFLLGYFGNI